MMFLCLKMCPVMFLCLKQGEMVSDLYTTMSQNVSDLYTTMSSSVKVLQTGEGCRRMNLMAVTSCAS